MQALFTREWRPDGPTAGGLVLVHGYAEHSGRYEALAAALNGLGIHVFAHDHRGHGRSPGPRGEIGDFPQLVADLHIRVEHAARVCAGRPLFLLGHSMGGLVALYYLASDTCRVNGAILSSPLLVLPEGVPAWKIRFAHWLGRFAPWLPVERLDASAISRDPDAVRAYETDPLIYHGAIRARTGAELLKAINVAQHLLPALSVPLLVLHGTADRLAPVAGGRRLYEVAASPDKSCHWDEGGFHELLNDTNREVALNVILDWIQARICLARPIPTSSGDEA